MTIEGKIREIAESDFTQFSYVFEDWWTADKAIEKMELPAIVCILPVSGSLNFGQYGRVKDTVSCAIAFLDKVPKEANGEENEIAYNAMKTAARAFLKKMNESGYFAPIVGDVYYNTIYEDLSSIVTGIMVQLDLQELVGACE